MLVAKGSSEQLVQEGFNSTQSLESNVNCENYQVSSINQAKEEDSHVNCKDVNLEQNSSVNNVCINGGESSSIETNITEISKKNDDNQKNQSNSKQDKKAPFENISDDYEMALKDLNNIAQNAQKILEDDPFPHHDQSSKRSLDYSIYEGTKKIRKDNSEIGYEQRHLLKIRKEFQKMSRRDLEDLVVQKMVAFMCSQSEIGILRQKCDHYDIMNDKWKRKVQALQKQCQDLNTVMKRYITDAQVKPKDKITPVRVTRSVGLQVMTDRRKISSSHHTPIHPITRPHSPLQSKKTNGNSVNRSCTDIRKSKNTSGSVIDLVDLSDEEEEEIKKLSISNKVHVKSTINSQLIKTSQNENTSTRAKMNPQHPAALPENLQMLSSNPALKKRPPKPSLKLSRLKSGIVLSWNLDLNLDHATISSYQLFAYQETSTPPSPSLWKKVGDVKALPLPMACTLTQFMKGNKYHFAVRASDLHNRVGPFSEPSSIVLS